MSDSKTVLARIQQGDLRRAIASGGRKLIQSWELVFITIGTFW
ncbi:MAG: hypothetical protein SAL70_41400 [Scytonema sp. PMC 1070.18]|nr:hypothetical protein [Scytonema sp. PMC 1070.18]